MKMKVKFGRPDDPCDNLFVTSRLLLCDRNDRIFYSWLLPAKGIMNFNVMMCHVGNMT